MTITRALSAAVSGLQAHARGTEVVAANMANVMTPGYGRRDMALSSMTAGGNLSGVWIDGVNRIVNMTLVSENRAAVAGQAEGQGRAGFAASMERLLGVAGEPGSIGSALSEFEAALVSASAKPEDPIRLGNVAASASALATKLNSIGDGIQQARTDAERQIGSDVANLNAGLDRVAELNRRITVLDSSGVEVNSLMDERQSIIDKLSTILPIRQIPRANGQVALFSGGGMTLLDGSEPVRFGFTASGQLEAGMDVAGGPLTLLTYGGRPVLPERMAMFAGGSMSAAFAVRDDLAPTLQREVDAIALDLHDRLADPAVDPSLAAGQPGLFTDNGAGATLANVTGLASRIAVNAAVSPTAGGDLWRVRAGIAAAGPGSVGDSSLLNRMSAAMSDSRPMGASTTFGGNASLDSFVGQLASRVASRRVSDESELAVRNSRASTIAAELMADGVDSDDEMRRLLQYQQAYQANAKVIQTIDEMMDAILRL